MQIDDVTEMAAHLRGTHGHLLTRLEAAKVLRRTSAGITTAIATRRPWALALEDAAVRYGRRRMYPAQVVAAVALRGDDAADYLAARQQEVGHE
jgi:hypothetical protein